MRKPRKSPRNRSRFVCERHYPATWTRQIYLRLGRHGDLTPIAKVCISPWCPDRDKCPRVRDMRGELVPDLAELRAIVLRLAVMR